MANSTYSCIYPLVETTQSPYIRIFETSCGFICQDPIDVYLFFTSEEQERIKLIIFVVCLLMICIAALYFCITLAERFGKEWSNNTAPFAYECPVWISSGYMLLAVITITPYIFGDAAIICNDDQTLIKDSIKDISCSLTAIGVYIGIRLTVFYTSALSVSLALILYYPKLAQKNRYYHCVVWVCIILGMIPILLQKSISGDYWLGICTTSLGSRSHLLWMNIIPLSGCVILFSVCMALAAVKLFRRSINLSNLLSVNEDLRSLLNRLLLYNLLQTASVASLVGNFCYWYVNLEVWRDTASVILTCEMKKTLIGETSPEDYEMCVKVNSHLPKPSDLAYWLFYICALVNVLGAVVFVCSNKVRKRSIGKVTYIAAKMMSSMGALTELSSRISKESEGWSPRVATIESNRVCEMKKIIGRDSSEVYLMGNDAVDLTHTVDVDFLGSMSVLSRLTSGE